MYPNEPTLNKEKEDLQKASFLGLSIEVRDRKFTTKLFYKRDFFNFHISHMPIWIATHHLKYFMLQLIQLVILHIARAATNLIHMVTHVNRLLI